MAGSPSRRRRTAKRVRPADITPDTPGGQVTASGATVGYHRAISPVFLGKSGPACGNDPCKSDTPCTFAHVIRGVSCPGPGRAAYKRQYKADDAATDDAADELMEAIRAMEAARVKLLGLHHAGTCRLCRGSGDTSSRVAEDEDWTVCPACRGHGVQDCSLPVCLRGC